MKLSRIGWALMSVIIIELALYFIGGATTGRTGLFAFLLNPSTSTTLYIAVLAVVGTITVAVVASSFFQLNIYAVYAGFVALSLTFVAVIIQLMIFISGQFNQLNQPVALLINGLITMPMAIYYMTTMMEWIRSNT